MSMMGTQRNTGDLEDIVGNIYLRVQQYPKIVMLHTTTELYEYEEYTGLNHIIRTNKSPQTERQVGLKRKHYYRHFTDQI